MSHLQPKDILALRSVSSDVKNSVQEGMTSHVFNINLHFKKLFEDPAEFRTYQAQAGALIGGEFARAIFDNTAPSVDKLEIYVHRVTDKHERTCDQMIGYIATKGIGYNVISPIDRKAHGSAELVLEKRLPDGQTRTIAIYCTENSPLGRLLHDAATTATLNFITWNRAYALFAQHTFVDRTAYLLQNIDHVVLGTWFRNQLVALKATGTKTLGLDLDDQFGANPDLPVAQTRCAGDAHTWKFDLDTTNIEPCSPPNKDALELSTFKLFKCPDGDLVRGPIDRYTMDAHPTFHFSVLKQVYFTVTDTTAAHRTGYVPPRPMTQYADKVAAVAKKMQDLTRLELLQVPAEQRPADYDAHAMGVAKFVWKEGEEPKTWTFFDDLLVKQLKKMWEEHEREQDGKKQHGKKSNGKK